MDNSNKAWHLANKMPNKATLEQRILWHTEHEKNCHCRPMPQKLREQIRKKEEV